MTGVVVVVGGDGNELEINLVVFPTCIVCLRICKVLINPINRIDRD